MGHRRKTCLSLLLGLLLILPAFVDARAEEPHDEPIRPRPGWTTAMDLVAGVYRSHATHPKPLLRFDDAGGAQYVELRRRGRTWTARGWSRQHGVTALVRGKRASLRFPAEAAHCADGCRVSVAAFSTTWVNRMRVALNGAALGATELGDRVFVARFEVPPGGLIEGENTLSLDFDDDMEFGRGRHAGGVRFVRIDPLDREGGPYVSPRLPSRLEPVTAGGRALSVLRRFPRTSWYLLLPQEGRLHVTLAAHDGSRARFSVTAKDLEHGARTVLLEPTTAPAGERFEVNVPLSPVAGRPVRLDFEWAGAGRAGVATATIDLPEGAPDPPAAVLSPDGVEPRTLRLGAYTFTVHADGRETLVAGTDARDRLADSPGLARLMRDVMGFWERDGYRWEADWGNPAFPSRAYWNAVAPRQRR